MYSARRWAIHLLPVLSAGLFICEVRGLPRPITLAIELQTRQCARVRVTYDVPPSFAGVSEPLLRTVDSRSAFETVRLPLNTTAVTNLRIVVEAGSGRVDLRRARLELLGNRVLALPLETAASSNNSRLQRQGETVAIDATNSDARVRLLAGTERHARKFARVIRYAVLAGLIASSFGVAWLLAPLPPHRARGLIHPQVGVTIVCLIVSGYLAASFLDLNGSAISLWRYVADRSRPNAGVLLGEPKMIRSDEWMVQTPWIMSEVARGFARENPNVGDGPMPLLNNLPVQHWSAVFRPQMWAFFLVGFERGFSFYWNFKVWALLLGAFLFLRQLCNGRDDVALFGTLLLYFSPFIQWWFSTPTAMPEMLSAFFFALWAIMLIQQTESRWVIAGAAVLLVGATAQFVFCSYPRFGVPLMWLAAFLLLGGIAKLHPKLRQWRISAFTVAVAALAALLVIWFREVAPAIQQVAALSYPGRIVSSGGGVSWQNFFATFLDFTATEQHFRRGELNVCNASGFFFVAPLLLAVCLRDAFRRRFDRPLLACTGYIVSLIIFMHYGIPPAVARWTGFSRVYSVLANIGIGVASVIALSCLLSRVEPAGRTHSRSVVSFVAIALIACVLLFWTNRAIGHFTDSLGVLAAAIFFALVFVCLWQGRSIDSAALLLPPLLYATALINPVVRGVSGITEAGLFRSVEQIDHRVTGAKWLVIGRSRAASFLPHLVVATGANVLGGTRCNPDAEMTRILDPTGRYAEIYNRHAAITFVPAETKETSFRLTFADSYSVALPLREEILMQLGITRLLEVDLTEEQGRVNGFATRTERDGLRLLERIDSPRSQNRARNSKLLLECPASSPP